MYNRTHVDALASFKDRDAHHSNKNIEKHRQAYPCIISLHPESAFAHYILNTTGSSLSLARHVAHALPDALEILLPERDLAVAAGDGEDVPGERPGDAPDDVGELARLVRRVVRGRVERGLDPRRAGRVFRPDENRLVLRAWSDRTSEMYDGPETRWQYTSAGGRYLVPTRHRAPSPCGPRARPPPPKLVCPRCTPKRVRRCRTLPMRSASRSRARRRCSGLEQNWVRLQQVQVWAASG